MTGTDNRKSRREISSHLIEPRGPKGLLFGALAIAALGCSGLADGKETYCLTEGQGVLGCGALDTSTEAQWACLSEPTVEPMFTSGKPAGLVLPVVEWNSRTPLMGAGLVATLCGAADINCAAPLVPPIVIRPGLLPPSVMLPPGAAGIPVAEGFDGIIKFDVLPDPAMPPPAEGDQFVSDFYYLGGVIAGPISQGPPILMFQRKLRSVIVKSSFSGVDIDAVISSAALAFGVYDCLGKPVEGARVELTVRGQPVAGVIPFRLPPSRIPDAAPLDQPLVTQASGGAGFLNVPPGIVLITAFRPDGTRIGQVQLGAVPGQLTIGTVRPDSLRKADISNSTPLATADMGMGGGGN